MFEYRSPVAKSTDQLLKEAMSRMHSRAAAAGNAYEDERYNDKAASAARQMAMQAWGSDSNGLLSSHPGRLNLGTGASSGGGGFGKFMDAIAQQESSGNYRARGVNTRYGQALGKYQILDSNFTGSGGWDREALGHDVSKSQFLSSPHIQDAIAKHKLKQYYSRYGGARGAAMAWYAGPGYAQKDLKARQNGGSFPSISGYAAQVLRRMGYL